jgi:hypothetical protein
MKSKKRISGIPGLEPTGSRSFLLGMGVQVDRRGDQARRPSC